MKLRGSVLIGIAIFFLAIGSMVGVSQATKNPQTTAATDPPLPIVHFKFETNQIPVAVPSEVTLGLPQCGFHDSALLILFMAKPNYEIKGMYSISSGKDVRTLAIPEPTDSTLKRYYVEDDANDSDAYILTQTVRLSHVEEDQRDPASYDILRFDDQGTLKETIHPDLKFRTLQMGVFPDGKFLILGFDEGNLAPRAAILDSGGSYVTSVDLGDVLPTNNELKAAVPPGLSRNMPESMKIAQGLKYYRFWHTPSGLALMKQDTNKIILITSGGVVTTVTPKIPKGYTANSFIQSDKRWLLRVMGPEDDYEVSKFDIYEFRSEDGTLVRKLDTEPAPSGGFACEHDGEFKLLHWIDKKAYLEVAKPK